jgi:hypothetical protein
MADICDIYLSAINAIQPAIFEKKEMSDDQVASSFVDQIRKFFGDHNITFGEFRPCFVYHEELDWLEYIEEDCCTVTEYQKGTNIALLRKWDGEKYCGVVGIKIEGFSEVAPPEVVEAFKAYNERRLKEWTKKDE